MQIKPERITPDKNGNAYTNIKFALSNAVSSDMMFKLNWILGSYIKENKYDGTMISTRNMEKPIYTSGWVDYLRNGYNYDQSAVKRQNRIAAVSGVAELVKGAIETAGAIGPNISRAVELSSLKEELADITALGQIAGKDLWSIRGKFAGMGSMEKYITGQYGLNSAEELSRYLSDITEQRGEIAKSIRALGTPTTDVFTSILKGRAMSSFLSAYNAFASIKSNNATFQAGLANKQAQSSMIEGGSNVDLFDQYSGGAKLEYNIFTMSEEDKNNIARVFYYLGYSHPVQEIPEFDTRLWFNFVQCDAVFNDEATCIYNKYIDDIKTRFKMGITVYHDVENQYDFAQEMENWETNIAY